MQKQVEQNVMKNLLVFIEGLSDKYNDIDPADIERMVIGGVEKGCRAKMKSGKRKGAECGGKAYDNGYCGRHQSLAIQESLAVGDGETIQKPKTKPKQSVKAREQIIELLSTAVPQEETVLKKHSLGLIHEESEIIFNEEFTVVGRVSGGKLGELTHFEIEICERMGWVYYTN